MDFSLVGMTQIVRMICDLRNWILWFWIFPFLNVTPSRTYSQFCPLNGTLKSVVPEYLIQKITIWMLTTELQSKKKKEKKMSERVNSNYYLGFLRYYPLRLCTWFRERNGSYCFCPSELDKVCISFRYTLIWMTQSKQITKYDSFSESVPSHCALFFTDLRNLISKTDSVGYLRWKLTTREEKNTLTTRTECNKYEIQWLRHCASILHSNYVHQERMKRACAVNYGAADAKKRSTKHWRSLVRWFPQKL